MARQLLPSTLSAEHGLRSKDVLLRKFRSERNFWLTLFAFTLWTLLMRLRVLAVELARAHAAAEEVCTQAQRLAATAQDAARAAAESAHKAATASSLAGGKARPDLVSPQGRGRASSSAPSSDGGTSGGAPTLTSVTGRIVSPSECGDDADGSPLRLPAAAAAAKGAPPVVATPSAPRAEDDAPGLAHTATPELRQRHHHSVVA